MKKSLPFPIALIAFFCVFTAHSQSTLSTIQDYLRSHASEWKLTPNDLNDIEITDEAPSKSTGIKHVYVRQKLNGLPVVNGLATVTLKNNQVIRVAQRFVKLEAPISIIPTISSSEAILSALKQLGDVSSHNLVLLSENKTMNSSLYEASTASLEPIPVRLMTQVNNAGKTELVYDLSILMPSQQNWWSLRVSAIDGTILFKNDWIQHCSFDECSSTLHEHTVTTLPIEISQMILVAQVLMISASIYRLCFTCN